MVGVRSLRDASIGRSERLVPVLAALAMTLAGCGGGGGDGPATTATTTTTLTSYCSEEQTANRCKECSIGSPDVCKACDVGYGLNTSKFCMAKCLLPNYTKPSPPSRGINNGIAWPDDCFADEEAHFFAIGDWGGVSPGVPFQNGPRAKIPSVDGQAQRLVAEVMNARASEGKPKFIINVGDNFYVGGINVHCGEASKNPSMACSNGQMESVFENMYKGDGMDGVPWYSVLGNHDWGGFTCNAGWDLQILKTYCPNSRWRMPGIWWSQKAQFRNFAIDIFFVDSNMNDVATQADHDICNPGNCRACNVPNATWNSAQECVHVMNSFWKEGQTWLEAQLTKSTADWRIVVTHFPPSWQATTWKRLANQYPIDLIVVGHTHEQRLYLPGTFSKPTLGDDFPATTVLTGGGGGCTSEGPPLESGLDDEYGFVDLTVSRTSMEINMISHGGTQHNHWITRQTKDIKPRGKASDSMAPKANAGLATTKETLVV